MTTLVHNHFKRTEKKWRHAAYYPVDSRISHQRRARSWMACVGRVAQSEEERKYEHCGADRDRDRTVTQDKQQRESEIKKREEWRCQKKGFCTTSELGMRHKSMHTVWDEPFVLILLVLQCTKARISDWLADYRLSFCKRVPLLTCTQFHWYEYVYQWAKLGRECESWDSNGGSDEDSRIPGSQIYSYRRFGRHMLVPSSGKKSELSVGKMALIQGEKGSELGP